MTSAAPNPSRADARTIAADYSGEGVVGCERFSTGLRNWVYDVVLASGRQIVVRLGHPDNRDELAGGVFWDAHLSGAGVRVAQLLAHDVEATQPFLILERLPGTDIGNVIGDLSDTEICDAALAVVAMHDRASSLPPAKGFGYALNYDSPLHSSWAEVINAEIDRALRWIESAAVVSPTWGKKVRRQMGVAAERLAQVEPTAYLHDATTKNVIVHGGVVVGLVDIDQMGFGDPFYAVALTRMSLLAAKHEPTFADVQAGELSAAGLSPDLLDFYTAVHCLSFLGELGQAFNQEHPDPVDDDVRRHLEAILGSLVGS